ncbi:MAG: DUF4268 domain-containing protein [Planctomycetota bacterium]
MIKQNLGKIKTVKLTEVFGKEDKDFTPWLNYNLGILGEKLGLDIIDSNIEEEVGRFYCDIIAKDSNTNKIIIIENQFGATDHDHLGKIFTYASGKNASIVIWIAEKFGEEHRKALEWINEQVSPDSGLSFFGVEIKLIKIENSPPAPDFKIVVKPNDWERSIKISHQVINETSKKYYNFFSKLVDAYSQLNPKWRKLKPLPQSWLSFGAGKSGLYFIWSFKSSNRIAVELYIDVEDENENIRLFEEIEKHKHKIEKEISGISWERLENRRACRIAIYKKIKGDIKSLTEKDYPEIIKWATKMMKEFSGILSNHIKNI